MKFFLKYACFIFVCFNFFKWYCPAQSEPYSVLNEKTEADKTEGSDTKPLFYGIWENKERIIYFAQESDKTKGAVVLKPFYRYYYDGIYEPHPDMDNIPLAVFGDDLYMQFWTAVPTENGVFWCPETNRSEFSIDSVPVQTELSGYYTDGSNVYEIRYWRTKADYNSEKAELHTSDKIVLVDKYIKIGETVYTAAVGRRTYIRNPVKRTSLPPNARISADGGLLVFGSPYASRSKIVDLEGEIQKHNSIVYPPRIGRAKFIEPSIYKKLESMSIEDFKVKPLRVGNR
ncbi:hypothetical protein H0R92_00305 [Treponema sp. OMZ 840]|uniref:hypothetical protein n=1 Tax=Treponema sp. OMZ 840 TaxID=244313 RepID=UPI003D8ABDEE